MKKIFVYVWISLVLVSCSNNMATPDPQVEAMAATAEAQENAVATALAGTQAAVDALPTPTITPTPGVLPLAEAILDFGEINDMYPNWSSELLNNTETVRAEGRCGKDCISLAWNGADGRMLEILLINYPNRGEAATFFTYLQDIGEAGGLPQPEIPEIFVALPENAWVLDKTSQGGGYAMHFRSSSVVCVLTLSLPSMSADQAMLFLGMYAEQQIHKLQASGYWMDS